MSVSLSRSLDTQCDLVFLFFSVKASTPVPRHQGPPVFSSSREDPSRSSSSHLTSYSPCIRVVCPLLDEPFVCLLYHPTSDSGLPCVLTRVGISPRFTDYIILAPRHRAAARARVEQNALEKREAVVLAAFVLVFIFHLRRRREKQIQRQGKASANQYSSAWAAH